VKKLVVGITTLLAMMASASARDLDIEPPAYEAAHSWRGFYIGGYGGGAWGGSVTSSDPCIASGGGSFGALGTCYSVTGGGFDPPGSGRNYFPAAYGLGSSAIAGITGGYNYQLGKYVLGAEAETGYIHLSGSGPYTATPNQVGGVPNGCPPFVGNCPNFTASSTFGNWYSTWTARVGVTGNFLFPSWADGDHSLLYAKVGPAIGRFSTSATSVNTPTTGGSFQFATSGADTVWGVAAGAGLEWALSGNWSLKGEYEYLGFHHSTTACGTLLNGSTFVPPGQGPLNGPTVPATTVCGSAGVTSVQTLKVGLNFSFR